jgi:hypothetical protein
MKKREQPLLFNDENIEPLQEIGDETEDDLSVDYLGKISQAVTWSTDWTVESLVNQLDRDIIDLNPKFQRRDAWNIEKKSRFIESLMYGLPIPQIVLAESPHKKGTYIVVDGKQRLITLKQFCSKTPNNLSNFYKLSKLKNTHLNDLTFSLLEEKQRNLYNNFINQSIRSVIIKNWPSETFLYTIFYRLNTGNLSLSPQELRRSLKPGKFMDYIDDFSASSKEIHKLLNLKGPDFRMRDMDLVIRYFAFTQKIKDYKSNYKQFLDTTCDYFNKNWDKNFALIESKANDLKNIIETVDLVFKSSNSFRRFRGGKFESRFNKSVFDIMVYYLDTPKARTEFINHGSTIVDSYKRLCTENDFFMKSISSNTNGLIETAGRFVIWGNELKKSISVSIPQNLEKIYRENIK